MRISAINNSYSFTQNKQSSNKDNNPISKTGEKAKLVKATFIAGLGLGGSCLAELADGDTIAEIFGNNAERIVNKQKRQVSQNKKLLLTLGVFGGLIAAFIGGIALLYTIFKVPDINYKGNINTFKKRKDMGIYIKGNKVEKELYSQMNEKAKKASKEEKAKLKEQYMQMRAAKNEVPDFAQ